MAEVHISFAGGIDEATQSQLVDPNTALLTIQNAHHDRNGALTKTLGCTPLAVTTLDGATISTAGKVFSHKDQLCMIDGCGFMGIE